MLPRTCSLFTVICLALLEVYKFGFAQESPIRLGIDPQKIQMPKMIWYGAYLEGKKVGYAKVSLGRKELSGSSCYSFEQTLILMVNSMGQKKVITVTEAFQFDTSPPYSLRYARHSDGDGLHEQTVEMAKTQIGFDVILKSGAETKIRQVPHIDLTLADILTPEQWFKGNPAVGDTITTRILDIRKLIPGTQTIKVLSQKSVIIDGVKITYYEGSLSISTMENSEIIRVDQQGDTLSVTLGGGLEVRLEPEELAKSIEYINDPFLFNRLDIDSEG